MILDGDEFDIDALDRADSTHLAYSDRMALRGAADKQLREAQDLLMPTPKGAFGVGDEVSFKFEGAPRKNGTLIKIAGADSIVEIERGECAVVPVMMLEPPSREVERQSRAAEIRSLLTKKAFPMRVASTREIEDGLYEARLQHRSSYKPSEDDVRDVISASLEGSPVIAVVDGEYRPGEVRAVYRLAQESVRAPGLFGEGLEGDEGPTADPTYAACTAQLAAVEAECSNLKIKPVGEVREAGKTEIAFEVHEVQGEDTRQLRINRRMQLTASRAYSVPATGRVIADSFGTRVFVDTPLGEASWSTVRRGAYDDMQSPNTPDFEMGHTKEPTQPLKRDMADPTVDDREHIGGPGLTIAEVSQPTKKYWNKLYENDPEYAKALTDDVKGRDVKASIVDAFAQQGRKVSPKGLERIASILVRGPQAGAAKAAQRTHAPPPQQGVGQKTPNDGSMGARPDLAQALIEVRNSNPQSHKAIDKLLVDYIAAYPEAVNRAGIDAYTQILNDAVHYFSGADPKRLEKLRMQWAPYEEVVDTAKQPSMWQRLKERVSPVEREMSRMDRLPGGPGTKPMYQTEQPPVWASKEAAKGKEDSDAKMEPRQPIPAFGDLGMRIDPKDIMARGSYVFAKVMWDPARLAGASARQIEQLCVSFLKGAATSMRVVDLGFVAGVRVAELKLDSGEALLQFRSSAWQSFPQQVRTM